MKYFIFLLACMSALALQAQTTSTKKYHNGMPDTVWHINGLDTFLTEKFALNGRVKERIWRDDSVYHFDNQGNIIHKIRLFKNNEQIDLPEALDAAGYYYNQEQYSFRSNGAIATHSIWKNDTLFERKQYSTDGSITDSVTLKTHPPIFEQESDWIRLGFKRVFWLDTAKHIKHTWYYKDEKLYSFEVSDLLTNLGKKESVRQYIEYDTNRKVIFEWALDSNALIPFKDNGLCLYGFVNLKSDTIIPARYESVQMVPNAYFQTYYIVQRDTKYGVLDALGNLMIPEIWSFLTHRSYQGRADSLLEGTWLECRGKSGFGILKLNGQMVLEPVYQRIGDTKKSLFIVKIGGAYGVVDKLGAIQVMPKYAGLSFSPIPNVYITEQYTKDGSKIQHGLIRQDGTVLLPTLFQQISYDGDGSFQVVTFDEKNEMGNKGIFNIEKGWILDTLYRIKPYNGYLFLQKEDSITVIDAKTMNPVLPFKCQSVDAWKHDDAVFLLCKRAGKMGLFAPKQQKWVLPLEYDVLRPLYDTLFAAKRAGIWEIISYKGQNIENKYFKKIGCENGYSYSRYDYCVQQGDSALFFNDESYPIFIDPLDLNTKLNFVDGIASFATFDGDTLFVNRHQRVLNPPHFRFKKIQKGSIIGLDTLRNMQILIDTFGKTYPFLPQYEIVNMQLNEDVILVFDQKTRKLGAVRQDGTPILPCTYFGLHPLDDAQVLWARKKGAIPMTKMDSMIFEDKFGRIMGFEWSYLDEGWTMHSKTGALLTKTVFDYSFDWLDSLNLGIGQVGGKQGLWKPSGENVLPPNYDYIQYDSISQIFHLFETQSIGNQRVRFADKMGHIIADGLFTKMSSFSGDYAFVETKAGLGIVQKNGRYLVAPQSNAFQKSSLDLMRLMMPQNDSVQYFSYLYDSSFSERNHLFNSLSIENQVKMNNVLLESIVTSYFLLPEQIELHRNISNMYVMNHEHWETVERRWEESRLRTGQYEVKAIYKTDLYLNFWTHFTETPQYAPRHGDDAVFESLNLKWDGQMWQRIDLKDVLDLNGFNMNYFTQLFTKKLSLLKDQDMDCSNPNVYLKLVQKTFLVLETGIQLHIARKNRYEEPTSIPLTMSWDELKPILKQ